MTAEPHGFIVKRDEGGLSEGAKRIPEVRDYIESMPDTARTFTLANIDAIDTTAVYPEHVEFAGAWPLHDHYTGSGERRTRYVNPNYMHATAASDLVVECACGALMTRARDDAKFAIMDEDGHAEGCMPFDRHRARADMSEARYEEMLRLTSIGWRGPRIATRFGISESDIGSLAQQFGVSLRGLRRRYKRRAAATYIRLLDHELGRDVADVYGHHLSTLSKWAANYREAGADADMPVGSGGSPAD